jgi:acyl transferase domain-containing protein/NAD(P)-dependent dehydrogenase (short-subunit alcohol dehydrogenase family)
MSYSNSPSRSKIAVVGVSALFPGSSNAGGFWRDILAGNDLIQDVPKSHWLIEDYYDPDPTTPDKTYARRGAFLRDIDFDALSWGIPPSIIPATDTSQLLALIVAQQVLNDATKGQFEVMDRSRISVILGVTSAQELLASMVSRLQRPVWVKSLREAGIPESEVQAICERIAAHYVPWQESSFPGLLGNVVAGRIANRLDLGGTNCVTDAACASTFSAISMAISELQLGDSDMVISGGVDTLNDIFMYMCFSKTPALSRTGDCRPFSDKADGTMLGEGLGMVALKRLEDAERDNDRIYAVIAGVGSSSDGRSKSVYAPVAAGQAKALKRAYEKAGYGPETVELVEAHGTGTMAGDAAEFAGLRLAFDGAKDSKQWCALGSVKSQIGHTKSAAGAAGIFKIVMALHHKVLPPTIKVDAPNPKMDLENSPFYLNLQSRPWVRGSDFPRRASVSSFGFGGSNFHIAIEEHVGERRAQRLDSFAHHLVLVTANDAKSLVGSARAMVKNTSKSGCLRWLAYTTQCKYDPQAQVRLALLARDEQELASKLESLATKIENEPSKSFSLPDGSAYGMGTSKGSVAFVFPGQGSQYVGMGSDVAMSFDSAMGAWDQAAGLVFDPKLTLHEVVFPRPGFDPNQGKNNQERLTQTQWAQPAIGVTSLSMLRLLKQIELVPAMVAGHSFGEVTALHAAGTLRSEDFLRVSRERGILMAQAAKQPGAMTVVSKPLDEVRELVARLAPGVVVANHNHPTQVVLSGPTEAIELFEQKLQAQGITAKRLAVATAFHSPVVADSCTMFGEFLNDIDFERPQLPVYSNALAAPYPLEAETMRHQLANQIAQPVRFVEMLEGMYQAGARVFVEVGPGSVLTGLVERTLGAKEHLAISMDRKGKNGVDGWLRAVAQLVAAGVPMKLGAWWDEYQIPVDPATVPASKLSVMINGSNYGKPYPPPGGAQELPPPNPESPRAVPNSVSPSTNIDSTQPRSPTPPPVQEQVTMSNPSHPTAPASPSAIQAAESKTPVSRQTASANGHAGASFQGKNGTVPAQVPHVNGNSGTAPKMAGVPAGWMEAFQETERQAFEVQRNFQQVMAQSHVAFLQTIQSSFQGLASIVGSPLATQNAPTSFSQPPAFAPEPSPVAVPAPAMFQAPEVAPVQATVPTHVSKSVPTSVPKVSAQNGASFPHGTGIQAKVPSASTVAVAANGQAPMGTVSRPSVDLQGLMLQVVADKTGYPTEMLALDMSLEGDLGIDSIKRVEILAAVQEQAKGLPPVNAAHMGTLQTLREIVTYMQSLMGEPLAEKELTNQVVTSIAAPSSNAVLPPAKPLADLQKLMLDVVSEKTGYPADMLSLGMSLEGDLGIDSIKRVEILAAVQEQAPGIPHVNAAHMGTLQTLQQIVDYLQSLVGEITEPTIADNPPEVIPTKEKESAPVAVVNLQGVMLQVVSEKTGYPADMLSLDMSLEGDLGIDSIKRVEIMAAVQEQAVGLPPVNAAHMGTLQTLQQIVDYLQSLLGNTASLPDMTMRDVDDYGYVPETMPAPSNLGRFRLQAIPAPAMGLAQPGLFDGDPLWVTNDGNGLHQLVVKELQTRGVRAQACQIVPTDATKVLFLGGLRDVATVEEAIAVNREAFAIARQLASQITEKKGVFVTVQDTGGVFGLQPIPQFREYLAGLPALVKTAAQEWPKASVKAIDLERGSRSPQAIAHQIVQELLEGGGQLEVGIAHDGTRVTLCSVAEPVVPQQSRIKAGDVVVVSGGAQGVTAACVIAWAAATQAKFVLLGRTKLVPEPSCCAGITDDAGLKRALLVQAQQLGEKPSPSELGKRVRSVFVNREIQKTLTAIRNVGGQARYESVSVTDAQALSSCLQSIREQWGPISALVHGAGVLADKSIAEKTNEQFNLVFDTKITGIRALLQATANDSLKVLCMFSSVSARCGNNGQSDYAMANEILSKIAASEARRRGTKTLCKSLCWGPWEGGMVTPALKKHFAALGVPMIPLDVGAQMFVDEIQGAQPEQIELVLGGEPKAEALMFAGSEDRVVELEVRVDRKSHGYLIGHSIMGTPVLPVALVLEWFARAARSVRPGLKLASLGKLQVLKGVQFSGFDNGGDRFVLASRAVPAKQGATLELELRSKDGRLHYRAVAEMVERTGSPTIPPPTMVLHDWADDVIYGDVLFHEKSFQVIERMDGVSDEGISGVVRGVEQAQWTGESWQLDVAALDGGLQMAVLWNRRILGCPTLPTGIEEFRSYSETPPHGLVRCVAQKREVRPTSTVTDIVFTDQGGKCIAELLGVETHLIPSQAPSTGIRA